MTYSGYQMQCKWTWSKDLVSGSTQSWVLAAGSSPWWCIMKFSHAEARESQKLLGQFFAGIRLIYRFLSVFICFLFIRLIYDTYLMLILCQHIFKTCLVSKVAVSLCCLVGKTLRESSLLEEGGGPDCGGVSNRAFIVSECDSLEMLGTRGFGSKRGGRKAGMCGPL